MSISRRIGLHVINSTALKLGAPCITKLVGPSLEYYRKVRAEVGPDCLIVVRWYHPVQSVEAPVPNAMGWFEAHRSWIMAVPASDRVVYEGWNEIGDMQAAHYASFELARLQLLHGIGRRACVGNWSVGVPDLNVWPVYAPVIAAMLDGDVVGLHEYWSSHADIDNLWHVRRFTLPAVARNLLGKRIAITECGRDIVEGQGQAGWQHTTDAAGYLDDLRHAGELYEQCTNVIGACVFQTGSSDPQWGPFNVYGVWPQVVAEYPAVAVPPVEVDMIPYFYSSREGYPITDIVIHDTEGPTQAALNWWKDPNNPGRSSAHVLVTSKGEVIRCVPDYLSAHHAGYATIPGRVGINPNRFTLGLELEYPKAPLSPPWPEVQLKAAAGVVRDWCNTYALTAAHIWEHKTIDPTRRSDPRNWDRAAFLARVWPPVVMYLPTNDPFMLARKTPTERYQGIRWWLEERKRQHEAGDETYANAIDVALIEQMYKWEREA